MEVEEENVKTFNFKTTVLEMMEELKVVEEVGESEEEEAVEVK